MDLYDEEVGAKLLAEMRENVRDLFKDIPDWIIIGMMESTRKAIEKAHSENNKVKLAQLTFTMLGQSVVMMDRTMKRVQESQT